MSEKEKKVNFKEYLNLIIPILFLLIILIGVLVYQRYQPVKIEDKVPGATSELIQLAKMELENKFHDKKFQIGFNSSEDEYNKFLENEYDIMFSYSISDNKDVESYLVASDAVGIIVHESNIVNDLSDDKLRAILNGEIKNWKDLGWEDIPIKIYLPNSIILSKFPGESVLEKKDSRMTLLGEEEIVLKISTQKEGIGFVDYINARNSGVKFLGYNGMRPNDKNVGELQYPLIIKIFVYVKRGNLPDVIKYLTSEDFREQIRASGLITLPKE